MSDGPLTPRHAGRVLLIDPERRVLLFRSLPASTGGESYWFPVGGELDPGETHAEAAAREAFEETGLADLAVGPEVFHRRFVLRWHHKIWDAQERWFIAHVPHFEPTFEGMEEIERHDWAACRWMSLDDLAAAQRAGDRLCPENLLELLPDLLDGRLPAEPISVGL